MIPTTPPAEASILARSLWQVPASAGGAVSLEPR